MEQRFLLRTSTKLDGNLSLKWSEDAKQVLTQREKFLQKHGLKPGDCVVMEVEHGDTVLEVDVENKQKDLLDTVKAEALITQTKGVILFLLTADCLPVTLYDPAKQVVALAHLGWKPTNQKLLPKVIQHMQKVFGSEPKDLLANIGPGIHKESYKHSLPLADEEELTALKPFIVTLSIAEVSIDLVDCNKSQLLGMGVTEEHIRIDPIDTATSSEYFSHYRSVRTGEQEGRFATIASLL